MCTVGYGERAYPIIQLGLWMGHMKVWFFCLFKDPDLFTKQEKINSVYTARCKWHWSCDFVSNLWLSLLVAGVVDRQACKFWIHWLSLPNWLHQHMLISNRSRTHISCIKSVSYIVGTYHTMYMYPPFMFPGMMMNPAEIQQLWKEVSSSQPGMEDNLKSVNGVTLPTSQGNAMTPSPILQGPNFAYGANGLVDGYLLPCMLNFSLIYSVRMYNCWKTLLYCFDIENKMFEQNYLVNLILTTY